MLQELLQNLSQVDFLLELILGGSLFLIGAIVVIIIFFGISIRETAENTKGLVLLALLSFSLPFVSLSLNNKAHFLSQAKSPLIIQSIEKTKINATTFLVSFQTEEPAIAYLEYKDRTRDTVIPILPTYSLEKRKDHSFLIEQISSEGGSACIIINGNRTLPKLELNAKKGLK